MKFSIGYKLPDEFDSTPAIVKDYPGAISEVYFALPGEPSGRAPLGRNDGWERDEAWEAMRGDLAKLATMDVKLVLLFNSACYGVDAMSTALEQRIISSVANVEQVAPLAAVTTTSLFVARVLKRHRPDMPVRASVNMRIGSTLAMEHLADCFSGYYLQRELNRSPATIEKLFNWCQSNGKSLHLLANSGCLRDCAYQSFHDNLVAHEGELANAECGTQSAELKTANRAEPRNMNQESGTITKPAPRLRYPAPCWEFLEQVENWSRLLSNTWIRPEDLYHYEKWFDSVKLATRMHSNPRKIIGAYTRGRYRGNLLDLFEPGHSTLLQGAIIDNAEFPTDWHKQTTQCALNCDVCTYCADVLARVLAPCHS